VNLRDGNGMVPIMTGDPTHPFRLVPLPNREGFFNLYKTYFPGTPEQSVSRAFEIVSARAKGSTLRDAGDMFEITKQRVKQIEDKFIYLMHKHLKEETSSMTGST
jgi:hypothetical protein